MDKNSHKKYVMDLHTHTLASGHAYNTMNEMIRRASAIELPLLGISDHAPAMPGSTNRYYFQNLNVLDHEKYGVRLLYGAELNIINYQGDIDLDDRDIRDLDYCIASLHHTCLTPGSKKENTYAYLQVMSQPKVIVIGHPDDGHFPVDYDELIRHAAQAHVLIELNNASFNPNGFRLNAWENDRQILNLCERYGAPILLGSDAHREEDIGDFSDAQKLLDEVAFPDELLINTSFEKLSDYLPHLTKTNE